LGGFGSERNGSEFACIIPEVLQQHAVNAQLQF